MAIINTVRNIVYAYDPQPDDMLVSVGWKAPHDDGKHLRAITLLYQPISEYAATVQWALNIADKMAYPIHVLPLNHNDIFRTRRFDSYLNFIANMGDQECGELRQIFVTTCCEVMRDCDDWRVRADAYDILRQLKVTHES